MEGRRGKGPIEGTVGRKGEEKGGHIEERERRTDGTEE